VSPLLEHVTVQVQYQNEVRHTVREALRIEQAFRKGTDPELYVKLTRDRAHLLVARLNQIAGVKAKLYGE
jgi:hypothetical protein